MRVQSIPSPIVKVNKSPRRPRTERERVENRVKHYNVEYALGNKSKAHTFAILLTTA